MNKQFDDFLDDIERSNNDFTASPDNIIDRMKCQYQGLLLSTILEISAILLAVYWFGWQSLVVIFLLLWAINIKINMK
jgi:hypothetical protein